MKITYLRHCISAHPVNYDSNRIKVSFKIDRHSLNDNGLLSIRDESNNAEVYNVFETLDEYIMMTEKCLEIICQKMISNCYNSAKAKCDELNDELRKIKNSR